VDSPDCDDVSEGQRDAAHLRDEDGGDGFVEGGAVHVDRGADGHHEAGNSLVNAVVLFQAVHRNGESRRTAQQNKSRETPLSEHEHLSVGYMETDLEAVPNAVASA